MDKYFKVKTYIENRNLRDCYRIVYQIGKIKAFLNINNYILVKNPKEANIVIILSCITFSSTISKNYKLLEEHIKNNKKVIFYGCISNRIKKELKEKFGNSVIIINSDNEKKFNYVYENIKISFLEGIYYNIDKKNDYLKSPFLVISKGCTNNCSYCIIKEGKKIESYSIKKILKLFIIKYNLGIRNFILASDNLGTYGIEKNYDIFDLIKKIISYDKSIKLNLHHVYPKFLIDNEEKIIELLKTGQINTIFSAIQHRNKRILKLMNRGDYNHNEFENILKKIKKNFPNVKLRTHLMYGFPTETYSEFLENFKNFNIFDHIYFFKFSPNYKINQYNYNLHSKEELDYRKNIIIKFLKKINGFFYIVNNDYINTYKGKLKNLFIYD